MDLIVITSLPETVNGNTCIVFVDRLSKMVHFAAAPTYTGALECAKLLRHHVCRPHEMPRDMCLIKMHAGKASSGLSCAGYGVQHRA